MAVQSPSQQARLPAHLALRIALASRTLKGVDTACLLRALIAAVGEPITEARLAKLRASRLRSRLSELALTEDLTDRQIHRALGLLKGRGVSMPEDPLPTLQAYQPGDMPNSIRVACASNSGETLDGIFGSCVRFLIYQISPHECRLIELRDASAPDQSDRYSHRADLLQDCQLLYTLSIGGPAAAKVVRAGIHPVRLARAVPARTVIEELQRILATAPPPWLAKVMGAEPGQRVRFSCDAP
ncbi:nitrogen fixation protein NifX [Azomonas agilis]|uniref:Nitrogen fixation protein NifX n=1 Tax=Azomonas agilis TaxID=116849 RepID=A0A562J2R4_9GAMM|nr:dinitrogenase iron-molybdenum cofactor biosynthesis protein [Azomonas agilis]TWH77437.1 nitrogen fixation protein NifX [Azomonas agilis]